MANTLGRANICPTEPITAIVLGEDGSAGARELRWGLLPGWAKPKGRPLINARDDKLASSGAWRGLTAAASGRAIIPAGGWLEWSRAEDPRAGTPRQPFHFTPDDGSLIGFAALWTIATPQGAGAPVASATIITTASAPLPAVAAIHDRMPAILGGPDAEAAWLDPAVELDAALALIGPQFAPPLKIGPVDPRLNKAGVEGLDLLEPASLF